jgi:polysaccharide pyruvyl transferase WcaK-like protein
LPSDEEASKFVIDLLSTKDKDAVRKIPVDRVQLVSGVTHPQDMLAEVSSCDLLIGMRLHSLIYAASQSVPLLGISYDPKINQFLNRLNINASATTSFDGVEFNPSQVAQQLLDSLDNRTSWKLQKHERIEQLKQEAQRPAQQIIAALRHKG